MDDGFFLDGSRLEAECRARGLDPEKIQRGPLTGIRYDGASSCYWPSGIGVDVLMLDTWQREVGENMRGGID